MILPLQISHQSPVALDLVIDAYPTQRVPGDGLAGGRDVDAELLLDRLDVRRRRGNEAGRGLRHLPFWAFVPGGPPQLGGRHG